MQFSLIEKRKEAGNATSFIFESDEPFTWVAGQYLHYKLPHENPDDRGIKRHFTISAAPFEGHAMLTTRLPETHRSTFKTALDALSKGGTIEAYGVKGDFTVDDPSAELVMIAGGIGVAPYRAMLLDMDKKGVDIHATLLYGNKDQDIVFKEELDAIAARHPHLTIRYMVSPNKIDEAAIRECAEDLTKPIWYVSGPEPMVEAFEKTMLGMGIPDEHFKRDFFPGYQWED